MSARLPEDDRRRELPRPLPVTSWGTALPDDLPLDRAQLRVPELDGDDLRGGRQAVRPWGCRARSPWPRPTARRRSPGSTTLPPGAGHRDVPEHRRNEDDAIRSQHAPRTPPSWESRSTEGRVIGEFARSTGTNPGSVPLFARLAPLGVGRWTTTSQLPPPPSAPTAAIIAVVARGTPPAAGCGVALMGPQAGHVSATTWRTVSRTSHLPHWA
jgi:hypothetical protein